MKRNLSLPVAAMCLIVSFSAFALPIYANVSMSTDADKVMKAETPKEYMQDFSVEGKQQKGQLVNSIFLSEAQISSLKTTAEKAFHETLGISIPQELRFECNTMPFDGVKIGLTWMDEKASASKDGVENRDGISYFADFYTEDISRPALLTSIGVKNGYDITKIDALKKQGMEALKKGDHTVTLDDYFLSTSVIVDHVMDENQNIHVQLAWSKSKTVDMMKDAFSYSYGVSFDKVDLSKNEGRVTALENMEATYNIADASTVEFTSIQEANMLEAAKAFLNEKEIGFGTLLSSQQIGNALWFSFDCVSDNNSDRTAIDVYIGSDLKVTGYLF